MSMRQWQVQDVKTRFDGVLKFVYESDQSAASENTPE